MRLLAALFAAVSCLLATCRRSEPTTQMEIPVANQSDERGIFLSWRHPVSQRTAILEEMDGMVWLYLSQPSTTRPVRDCPAFASASLPDSVDWQRIKQTGEPPRISKDVASDRAVIMGPVAADFSTVWSADGESVALRHQREIVCMIVAGAHRGHSRALARACPLGLPFDQSLASITFDTATR